MSRMTDERLALYKEFSDDAKGLIGDELIAEVERLRAKVAEDLEAACKAVMQAGIATGHADSILMMLTGEVLPYVDELRAKVAELERAAIAASHAADIVDQIHDERLAKLDAAEAKVAELEARNRELEIPARISADMKQRAEAAEAKVRELEKQSDGVAEIAESMARKAQAAEAQLAALRERVIGLMGYFATTTHLSRCAVMEPDSGAGYVIRQDVLNLLTQTSPEEEGEESIDQETLSDIIYRTPPEDVNLK